ncbi:GntR family transcriptional regulator [Lactobacillus sp. M0403]|nr:GntR family transcriptional regulator [Lactobacillus sp. M0403]
MSISRYTVRKALDELEKKGYIYKVHGKGTFVSEKSVPSLVFTPHQEIASKLHVVTRDKVIKLKYLRTADDVPMMIEETYLPYSKFPTLTVDALSKNSLYSIMKTEFNQSIHVVSESMRASLISSNEAKLLKVEDGSPCLNVRRTSFNKLNEPIEFTSCIARGDQFVYNYKYIHQD